MAFWCRSGNHAILQEIQARASIHGPLDELELINCLPYRDGAGWPEMTRMGNAVIVLADLTTGCATQSPPRSKRRELSPPFAQREYVMRLRQRLAPVPELGLGLDRFPRFPRWSPPI